MASVLHQHVVFFYCTLKLHDLDFFIWTLSWKIFLYFIINLYFIPFEQSDLVFKYYYIMLSYILVQFLYSLFLIRTLTWKSFFFIWTQICKNSFVLTLVYSFSLLPFLYFLLIPTVKSTPFLLYKPNMNISFIVETNVLNWFYLFKHYRVCCLLIFVTLGFTWLTGNQ